MTQQTAFSQFRKSTGKTLESVAEIFRVTRRTVIRWEKGSTLIPVKRLDEVERVTGIPRQQLRPDVFTTAQQHAGAA